MSANNVAMTHIHNSKKFTLNASYTSITITVCATNKWGVECANTCGCGSNVEECSPVTGCTVCKAGWTDYNCVQDIDECANADDNECDLDASSCENVDGSYNCICNVGSRMVDGVCTGKHN